MAVDTAQKRLSALSIAQIYIPGLVPDGTISSTDMQGITYSYTGISAGVAVVQDVFPSGMLAAQHVRRKMHRGRR